MSDGGNGDFEFERRFWVRDLPVDVLDGHPALVVQSYLLADEGWAVRVRVQVPAVDVRGLGGGPGGPTDATPLELLDRWAGAVDFAAVTVKGPMVQGTRYEAERELDPLVGVELVRRGGAVVGKWRHAVWLGDDGWVVDVFVGADAPLVVAEVERGGPVTDLTVPAFCTTEVTADGRFANDALARRPYGPWADAFRAELAARGPVFLEGLGHNHLDGAGPRG